MLEMILTGYRQNSQCVRMHGALRLKLAGSDRERRTRSIRLGENQVKALVQDQGDSMREPTSMILFLAFATLVIEMAVSADPRWGYDEAWHLYISTVSPWKKALEEAVVDAHPPLHYLFLAPLSWLGSSPLWCRLPSVAATVIAVPVWHFLLRRLGLSPVPALLGTYLLVTSFAFLEVGATVRAYSLGMLCLVVGLHAVAPLLPGAGRMPAVRQMLFVGFALSAAFWFMYAAVFVIAALCLAIALVVVWRDGIAALAPNRWVPRVGGGNWLGLVALVVGNVVIFGWFIAGYARRGGAAAEHTRMFMLDDGGSIVDFLLSGLSANAGWLLPQFGQTPAGTSVAAAMYWGIAAVVLAMSFLRHQPQRATLALAAFLATGLIAGAGLARLYPFGGLVRHQYVLLPLYLLVICFLLDALWARAESWARTILAAAVIAFGAYGLQRALLSDPLGEAYEEVPWAGMVNELAAGPDDTPVYLAASTFYPIYAASHPQGISFQRAIAVTGAELVDVPYESGWLAGLGLRRNWDVFNVHGRSARDLVVIRDRGNFAIPAEPDNRFAERLVALMRYQNIPALRILRPSWPAPGAAHPSTLRHGFEAAGLEMSGIRRSGDTEIWTVRLLAQSSATGVR